MTGFLQMRFEVTQDAETICMTDCEVSAASAFVKKLQELTKSDDTTIEFRDNVEKKYVRLKYETGNIT